MRRFFSAACSLLIVSAGAIALQTGTAEAVQAPHDRVVSPISASFTPHVGDSPAGQKRDSFTVYSFAQVGNTMVAGGKFDHVRQTKDGAAIPRSNVFAFDATTGAITSFAPAVDGEVDALWPGPDGTSVFIGGKFNNVNGVISRKIARLNLSNGQAVSGFKVPFIDGPVNDFAISGGRLFVGGQFDKVNAIPHSGLAALNPATGALDSYMNVQLTGHHNWNGAATGFSRVGVYKFDITANGQRMVAVGNFKLGNGGDHDQVVMIDLGSTSATIAPWQTNHFKNPCASTAFDSWVRDVGFGPDGSYFAVATTGAPAGDLCDSVSRWESANGADLHPTWVNYTGGDSLWSIAVTGAAIYIGGHERWSNNTFAGDSAGPGAVPRPGVGAFDPVNGLPLTWNPGRNPRGAGAFALLATPTGLWVGSDTNFIGNRQAYRGKLVFFPLAGGKVTPSTTTATLPATVYQGGKIPCNGCAPTDSVLARSYDGANAVGADSTTVTEPGFWSNVRGAVLINGELFFGSTNGYFYKRSFNGTTFGAWTVVDPYNDPYWSNVSTGRGTTYRGLAPSFYVSEIPFISSMFYTNGRLYYTFIGQPGMYYRYFTPESGVVGTDRFQVADGLNWADAASTFQSGNQVFVASRATGTLYRFTWDGTKAVAATAVALSGPGIDGKDWRANAMWLR